jgi:hypothetical protein
MAGKMDIDDLDWGVRIGVEECQGRFTSNLTALSTLAPRT